MTITFYPGIGHQCWDALTVRTKLENIAKADKTKQWIQADLSTPQAGEVGKFFWKVMGKHFQGMRGSLYSVDIERSKNILERLGVVVQDHLELTMLFMRAVENFERMTGRCIEVPSKVFQQYLCIQQPSAPMVETVVVAPPPVVVHEQPVPVIIHEPPVYVPPVVIERHFQPVVTRRPWFNSVFNVGPRVVPPPIVTRQPVFTSGANVGPRVVPGTGMHTAPTVTRQPVFTSRANVGPRVVPGTGAFHRTNTFAGSHANVARPKCSSTRVVPGFAGTRRR